jgi:hypothetical protein
MAAVSQTQVYAAIAATITAKTQIYDVHDGTGGEGDRPTQSSKEIREEPASINLL